MEMSPVEQLTFVKDYLGPAFEANHIATKIVSMIITATARITRSPFWQMRKLQVILKAPLFIFMAVI
jgi:hypothetical protein